MEDQGYHLYSAFEIAKKFGIKYFYRQRIYRLAESKKIPSFQLRDQACFIGSQVLEAVLKDLEFKIEGKFPQLDITKLRVFYDLINGKRIVVDGIFGKSIFVDTDKETEEDLIQKIGHIMEWINSNSQSLITSDEESLNEELVIETQSSQDKTISRKELSLVDTLPEEIMWIKIDTGLIENIEIKSFILISLPSIAQFIGIRQDQFIEWIAQTSFTEFVLSAHYKKFQGTEKSVPWKKGVISGYTSFVPFELLPEIVIAFKQSGRSYIYPQKAELLYQLSKSTLEAVGLAISGNKDKAAQELARVGKGLGLNVADQIIGIFKQYESRDYQIQTSKEFFSKVKEIKEDYAVITGKLTLGITGRWVSHWKMLGKIKKLPSKVVSSSREVMRKISPADGVGMTFGEKHFIKDPNLPEAIETGKKGKSFYERLKKVGLLDN